MESFSILCATKTGSTVLLQSGVMSLKKVNVHILDDFNAFIVHGEGGLHVRYAESNIASISLGAAVAIYRRVRIAADTV